ncbi:hypothetical protein [Deinococcus wulumuqiensis]|uniref:Uncharacterized protein n=2 Tax=Deinococcus wulumuqiensis TaxID=980427 RepID=A0AAV4K9L6_9DEIO|nr:hypothetical protein [Deinococcus wulumuqiensis]GGI67563.1 hypothetical protein GCM10008021_29830 [Deinococcus wulumuqiensis]GGI86606.1 hypothetical protein GCM10010914_21250 [Deinococcus wulumuqiensis]
MDAQAALSRLYRPDCAGIKRNPYEAIQAAARQMYSWGDLAELLLGVLLFWGWLRERDRARARERARGGAGAGVGEGAGVGTGAPAHARALTAEGRTA